MPAFGKRVKEESINDKMVRLFKEGMSVAEISNLLDVKQDVITNVIRRRCGEDSIPDTVIRSKNAVPKADEAATLKADAPAAETVTESESASDSPASAETSDESSEGLSKLERFMVEKEKKRQEEAEKASDDTASEEAAAKDETAGEMEGISLEGLDLDSLGSSTDSAVLTADTDTAAEVSDIASAADAVVEEMADLEVPEISEDTVIEEVAISAFEGEAEPISEIAELEAETDDVAETFEEQPEDDQPAQAETETAVALPSVGHSSSAFDKMKAFAQMQIAENNEKLAELEAQLESVEGDYTSQLEEAEKEVEAAKVAYEDIITKGEDITDKRSELQAEHRAALARAEEDYRKKLDEIEQSYNEAIAHANESFAEKEEELNAQNDDVDSEKEIAKNNFLDKQSVVVDLKEKIENEVESVKKQIAALKEENKSYESFMN